MDHDFIAYYRDNLAFLREQSAVFARQYPRIARNLGLSSFECSDPFVERLLEGTAFLAARNDQKLDQGATLLLQDLLSCLAPALSCPHPAQTNVCLRQLNLQKQSSLKRGTLFKTKVNNTTCRFSTLFDVDFSPVELTHPELLFQLEETLSECYDSTLMRSGLSFTCNLTIPEALPEDLEIFCDLPEAEAGLVLQQLTLNLTGVFFKDTATDNVYTLNELLRQEAAASLRQLETNPELLTTAAPPQSTPSSSRNQAVTNPVPASQLAPDQTNELPAPRLLSSAILSRQAPACLNARSIAKLRQAGLSDQAIASAFHTPSHASSGFNQAHPLKRPQQVRPDTTDYGLITPAVSSARNTTLGSATGSSTAAAGSIRRVASSLPPDVPGSIDWDRVGPWDGSDPDELGSGSAFYQNRDDEELASAIHQQTNNFIYAQLSVLSKRNLLQEILKMNGGLSCLDLYLSYPRLLHYCLLKNLGRALRLLYQQTGLNRGQLIFTFSRSQTRLNLSSQNFLTNTLPLINLFPKRCSHTELSLRSNYHIVPERTQPDDFEIITIKDLELLDQDHRLTMTALPYFSHSLDPNQLFFTLIRRERTRGTFVPRSPYPKSECFVAICTRDYQQLSEPGLSLAANTWCSNADLPLTIKQGTTFSSLDDELSGTCLELRQQVLPAAVTRSNERSYELLSCFNLHLNALLDLPPEQMLFELQELIRAYGKQQSEHGLNLLARALTAVRKEASTFRFIHNGIVFFEPGLSLELTLDPEKSGGNSLFFLANTLCTMLKSLTSLNRHCSIQAVTREGEVLASCL